jgi:hypothetical protein
MDICGLSKGRAHLYVDKASASHVYLCKFPEKKKKKKKKTIKQSCREYWYGRPESLQTQTLAKTQKKGNKTNSKIPQKYP